MSKISHGFLTPFTLQLSFHHIITQLSLENAPIKLELLERARAVPELSEGIYDSEILTRHEKLISELLEPYFPPALTNNEIKAVGLPFQIEVFNLSSRFQSILEQAGKRFEFNIRDFDLHQLYVMSCTIVMNRIYGTQLDFGKPLFYDIPTSQGIIKHYRILYNADFLEVIPTEKAIPLTEADIELLMDSYDDLDLWMRLFPVGSYLLRGFSIMTLFDATVENAVSTFKGNLLGFNPDQFKQSLDSIFSSIFRIADLRVGYVLVNPGDAGSDQLYEIDARQSILVSTCLIKNEDPRFWKEYLNLVDGVKYYCSSNIGQ
ncbi:MAG: GAF domain-containing protein, partial [Chitinophagaceae bacterium]